MTATIDKKALCIIVNADNNKPLGTGFVFLKENWIVTAKHVILDMDNCNMPLQNIKILFFSTDGINKIQASVLAMHKENDIAILIMKGVSPCRKPLNPTYLSIERYTELISIGYSPSKSNGNDLTMFTCVIKPNQIDIREREKDNEYVLEFDTEFIEGGNSGSPLLADGALVIGIITNQLGLSQGRATSIHNLMNGLIVDWKTKEMIIDINPDIFECIL